MSVQWEPPVRPDIEYVLAPWTSAGAASRDTAVTQTLATTLASLVRHGWLRKSALLVLLALIWEVLARWQNNDLLLPGFVETAHAFADGVASGEIGGYLKVSLGVLLTGYAAGIACAFVLTALAMATTLGRDLLETATAMFNPLPAIALLPLALLWFGLGQASLIFVLVHSVTWPLALSTYAGFRGVPDTLRMAGRNYGLTGLRLIVQILIPGLAGNIVRSENRLGLLVAHLDRRRADFRHHLGQRRTGLVHFSKPQRVIYRQGIRRPGRGNPGGAGGGAPGISDT